MRQLQYHFFWHRIILLIKLYTAGTDAIKHIGRCVNKEFPLSSCHRYIITPHEVIINLMCTINEHIYIIKLPTLSLMYCRNDNPGVSSVTKILY